MYETDSDGYVKREDTFSLQRKPALRGETVYALVCRRANNLNEERRRARKRIGRVPDWLPQAVAATERVYVGYSQNANERIDQHYNGQGAQFTKLFEPRRLLDIWDSMSETRARNYEEQTADRIRQAHPQWFVYWA